MGGPDFFLNDIAKYKNLRQTGDKQNWEISEENSDCFQIYYMFLATLSQGFPSFSS